MRDVTQLSVKRCRCVNLSISKQCGSFGVPTNLLTENTCVRQAVSGRVAGLSNFNRLRGVGVVRQVKGLNACLLHAVSRESAKLFCPGPPTDASNVPCRLGTLLRDKAEGGDNV